MKGILYIIKVIIIAQVVFLSSCTDNMMGCLDDRVPIQVLPSVVSEIGVQTRAGNALNNQQFDILTSANSNSKVQVMIDNGSYQYSSNLYNVTSSTGITPATQPYFPAQVTTVNLYAWYPYNSGSTSFSINTDQTSDANYSLSDLMVAQPTTCTRSQATDYGTWTVTPANLQFKHMMSKVSITVVPTSLTIKKIELKGIKPTVAIETTKSSSKVTKVTVGAANGTAGAVTLWSNSSGSTSSVTASCVIPAQTISGTLIEVTTSDNTVTIFDLGTEGKQFAQNTTYSATLNLSTANKGKTIDISAWVHTEGALAVMSSSVNTFCTMTAELNKRGHEYDGNVFKPIPTVTYTRTDDGVQTTLTEGTDYIVHYTTENGTTIANPVDFGSYYCVVTGIGNYSGTINLPFTIARPLVVSNSSFNLYVYNTITGKTDFSTFTVTAPESVTWNVTSNNTSVATVTNYTASGTSCTVTVRGQAVGSTLFNIRASSEDCDYSTIVNCNVYKSMMLTDVNENETQFVGFAVTANGYLYPNGAAATSASETVIGMIAYIGANGSAEASGNYKGLIVGAQPGQGGADWAEEASSTYSTTYDQLGYYTDNIQLCKSDMYGLAYTQKMVGWGETYAGAQAVIRGDALVEGGITGMTSTWFLPAIGQFLKAFDGVNGSEVFPDTYAMTSQLNDVTAFRKMNTALVNAGCSAFVNTDYWTSSESSAANVVNPDLYDGAGEGTFLRLDISGTTKNNRRKQLSPFLAF